MTVWLPTETACGALIAGRDWSCSPLGPIAGWPASLRTMLAFLLRARIPMVMLWGEDGVMLYNDAYSHFAGARHPALLGMAVRDGWPEVADFNDNVMRVCLAGGSLRYKDQELTLHRRGLAEQVFMDLDYSPVPGDDGKPAGVLALVVETTPRVQSKRAQRAAEAALVAERDRARGVLERMTEGFVLLDRGFRVVDINAEGLRLEQRAAADIIGKTQWEAWPGSEASDIGALYRRAMAENRPVALEHRFRWPDGHTAWLDMRAYPGPDGLAIFYKDVTERHIAAEQAAAAAERVQFALDAGAIIGTWVWNVPNDNFVADERFALAFGLDPERCRAGVASRDIVAAIHPDDVQRVASAIAAVLATGGQYRCDHRVLQADAQYRWVEVIGRVELRPDGSVGRFSGVLLDIAPRRAAEAERDRVTTLLRIFAEAVPGVVYAKDRNGRMLVANKGTTALIGKPPSEYINRTDAEFLDDKDQAARVMATDRRIMETGIAEQVEEAVSLPDGQPAIWLSTKAPLRDERGAIVGLVGASVDITARVAAEAALAEALAARDVLLHEVNHRVKNSLQIVTSLLMLQAGQAREPALRQSLLEARSRVAVIAGMHQRLYTTSQHDRVDFGDYVRELAAEAFSSMEHSDRIRFETDIEPEIFIILDRAVSLALVVNELVTNAMKYAFPGQRSGRVRLALTRCGGHVGLIVADDGIGLPAGFDPAQSASLGMKIVSSLVRQVRGTLSVGSDGAGAVFRIDIPTEQFVS